MKRQANVDLILLFVTIIWGVNPTVIKLGLGYMPTHHYNIMRLIIASATALLFIIASRKYKRLERGDIKKVLLVSVGGFFVFQWFYTTGIGKTTAGNTSIIMGVLPLMVMTINHICRIKKADPKEYIGVGISLIGIVVVIMGTGKLGLSLQNIIGCLYIFIACIGNAIYTVFSKKLSNSYSSYQITAYAIVITTALMVIFTPPYKTPSINSVLVFSLLFSGIMGVCVGNFAWVWCIKKTDSNRASIINNITPVFSVISGVLFLKEKFTLLQFLGALIILLGLYFGTYRGILNKIELKD